MNQNVIKIGKVKLLLITGLVIMSSLKEVDAQNEYKVVDSWLQYTDLPNSLYHHFTDEAYSLLDERKEKVLQLRTKSEWEQRQKEMRQIMWKVLGPLPDKTPLNPQITGKVQKDGFSIENIIYESLPGFYVTASLFLPDNLQKPNPAILFCSGHSTEAYRKQSYQMPLLNLVKKGFIVLAIDPVGQGERLQYFDIEKGLSIIGSSTKEHSYPSVQTALIGQSVARYFVWDGIRGIDYLVGRKEVDSKRIGVHGLSGGGTQTAYISALDDRVAASAPACYITSYRRLMESIGVQDGEQNFYHGLINNIDHADFIEMRAPKPTLIMANTSDFFSIQGARETYAELKNVYSIFAKEENIEIVEDDYGHGYTQKNREAMYAFFQKHLDIQGSADEQEVDFLSEEELQKTSTGQLASSYQGETIFSLNKNEAGKYISKLQNARKNFKSHLKEIPGLAMQLSGYRKPSLSDNPVLTGRIQRDGLVIEKYFIKGEGDYVLPYLLFTPDEKNGKAIIYLHPMGKAGLEEDNKEWDWLLKNGFTILAPDLPGIGELGDGKLKGDAFIDNISYNMWYNAMLIGRSIVGVQASDVVKLSYSLLRIHGFTDVFGIARGEMSPVLLHAAVFDS
ncbi:MAG TPA: alpha/beta hydrolase family protein, partial [Mariniphaga sp.]|nr:alpha/beta hydrolase family protein [Mariniphaga sp.]